MVAADQELLDSLTELHIEPINVDGASQSFSAKASVTALSSFRSISADEVYVTVNIVEEKISVWIENVPINYINLGENLDLNNAPSTVRVLVTGPRSQVAALSASGMMATINLEGLAAGEYTLTPDFNEDSYPEIMFTTERSGVSLELSEQSAPDEEAEIAK